MTLKGEARSPVLLKASMCMCVHVRAHTHAHTHTEPFKMLGCRPQFLKLSVSTGNVKIMTGTGAATYAVLWTLPRWNLKGDGDYGQEWLQNS